MQPASSVEPLLRTALLYADRAELRASFVLRDADGRSLVSLVGLVVQMVATGPAGATLTSSACAHGAVAHGVGDCASSVPADWFSPAVTAQVRVAVRVYYSSDLVASAHADNATLAASPVHTAPTAAGLRAVMPRSPRFRGDEFELPISAHTNPAAGYALNAWSLELSWAPAALELVSISSSPLYATPTVHRDDAAATLRVAVVGTQASTSLSDVTGTAVHLLTARLRVRAAAADNHTHSGVLNLTALELLNQGSYRFVENGAAQIDDARGGSQASGQLTVERLVSAGRLVHTALADLVNTAALSGTPIERGVGVVEGFSRAATGVADASSALDCNSTNTALLGTGGPAGCTLVLSGRETGGGNASVLLPALARSLRVRVWYPISVSVSIGDELLHRISGAGGLSSVYQSTDVVVLATFGGEGLAPVVDVDVSSLVTLSLANSSVATLDADFRLHGLAAGSTTLRVSSAPALSVQASVTVSDTPVELSQLQVLLVTGVAWETAAPATVALGMMPGAGPWRASFNATVQLEQQLAAEGDVAEVFVYATFADGATQQVPATEVLLASNLAGVLTQVAEQGTGHAATMTVAAGAAAFAGDVLTATWRVGNETLGSGVGWANLTLPLPVLVTATASQSRVAPPDDSAAKYPISLRSSFAIAATVHYDDGTSKDFSSDARLNVSLAAASAECASVQGLAQVEGASVGG